MDVFWIYFGCFSVMIFGIFPAQWFESGLNVSVAVSIYLLMAATALVLFVKGMSMAVGWSDPFAGKWTDVAKTVSSARGALAVIIATVWPFAVMIASAFIFLASVKFIRRCFSYRDQ